MEQEKKQATKRYNDGCKELNTDICFGITNNKSYGRKFKCRLNKLVSTKVTDITFLDRKYNGGKPRMGNCIKANSILAISLKQKYQDVVLRCAVQHGGPNKPDVYLFHCYVVVLFKGKGPWQQSKKKKRYRRNVECEMVFDYSNGKRRVWPYEFYESNLFPSTYMGRTPEIWKQDLPVTRTANFEHMMYDVLESNPYQRNYQLRLDRKIYSKPYDASGIMSLLLDTEVVVVEEKGVVHIMRFVEDSDEECDCEECRAKRLTTLKRNRSP